MSEGELHPEEGKVPQVTAEDWAGMLNTAGQLEDDLPLRKVALTQITKPCLKPIFLQ